MESAELEEVGRTAPSPGDLARAVVEVGSSVDLSNSLALCSHRCSE